MFAKDGTNMEEHIWKLYRIYLQLNARGCLVSNEDFLLSVVIELKGGHIKEGLVN